MVKKRPLVLTAGPKSAESKCSLRPDSPILPKTPAPIKSPFRSILAGQTIANATEKPYSPEPTPRKRIANGDLNDPMYCTIGYPNAISKTREPSASRPLVRMDSHRSVAPKSSMPAQLKYLAYKEYENREEDAVRAVALRRKALQEVERLSIKVKEKGMVLRVTNLDPDMD
ncbi:hypothetical protein N0V90_003395 [Kalmusia sp. IMI 367209]|nr:hypothetical protein N0V90_003395 [Kalmusia sp. IMI 367209]